MLFRVRILSVSSAARIVKIGISPALRGISKFSRGMEARLAMSMVTTNSEGSICPSCRLPMRRMTISSTRYMRIVRRYATKSLHR